MQLKQRLSLNTEEEESSCETNQSKREKKSGLLKTLDGIMSKSFAENENAA